MKKNKVSGFLIYLLCLAAVLLGYFYAVYLPVSARNAQLDAQHTQNSDRIKTYREEIVGTKAINDNIAELQGKLDAAKKSAPIGGGQIAEDAAKAWSAAGITPQEIQTGSEAAVKNQPASGKGQLMTVPVSIRAVCTQEQMQKLLDYFEKQSAGCYYVNSVQYTQNPQKGSPLTLNLSMTLYYFGAGGKTK